MAIKNRKKYNIYLNEKDTEYLKSFLETTKYKGGLSGYLNAHVRTTVKPLRAAKYKDGKKLTVRQLLKFGLEGLRQEAL